MKALPICKQCMLNRADKTILASGARGKRAKEARKAVEKMLAKKFNLEANPSYIGTLETIILARKTGGDPYRRKKLEVIKRARKIVGQFEKWIGEAGDEHERFRRAALVAICGNTIEISAAQHAVDVKKLDAELWRAIKRGLAIDELGKIYERARKAKKILYLCDNCGEAIFDELLMKELKKYAKLTIAVAGAPVDDDVTLREAGVIGLGKLGKVVSRGQNFGVFKGMGTKEFWKAVREADLIIGKGMANYETITDYPEIERKTAFLFKVKCVTVGRSVGAAVNENIALLARH